MIRNAIRRFLRWALDRVGDEDILCAECEAPLPREEDRWAGPLVMGEAGDEVVVQLVVCHACYLKDDS